MNKALPFLDKLTVCKIDQQFFFSITRFKRKIQILTCFLLLFNILNGQSTSEKLVGLNFGGTVDKLSSLNVNTDVFTNIANLSSLLGVFQGESTFDCINQRYFAKTGMGNVVIDVNTGNLNTLPSPPTNNLIGLEYNTCLLYTSPSPRD